MATVFAEIACSIGKTAKECQPEFRLAPLPLQFAELLSGLAEKECSQKAVETKAARKMKSG
jgi:hypothetical protein